jgi:hypothetical protein
VVVQVVVGLLTQALIEAVVVVLVVSAQML